MKNMGSENDGELQVCYYLIQSPRGVFSEGKIQLEFAKVEGLDIFLYRTGREQTQTIDFNTAKVVNSQSSGKVQLNQAYSLDQEEMFILIALPTSKTTSIEITYST